jgi:hypothetical protein
MGYSLTAKTVAEPVEGRGRRFGAAVCICIQGSLSKGVGARGYRQSVAAQQVRRASARCP